MSDLVSIIIPVYNAERFLKDTIESIHSQTYSNWEAIFVNDCSTDNSAEIIRKYQKKDKRILFYEQEKNGGPALARNKGIDLSKGRYICFIDADDLWDTDKLQKQIEFMNEKDCAFSYHSYEYADEKCIPNGKKVIAKEKLTYRQALKNNIISTITVMFDTKKMNKELIKMPNLKYVEDTATWWKILRSNYIAYGIPSIYAYYRRIPNSNSSNKFRTLGNLWYVYRKEEKLDFIYALYCFTWKNVRAILRRI